MRISTLLIVAFSISALVAQQPAAQTTGNTGAATPDATNQQQPPAPKPASIEGTIITPANTPLKKAEVSARRIDKSGGTAHTATSGEGGKFKLADLEPGSYMLTAQRAGYTNGAYGAKKPGSMGTILTVTAGQEMTEITIKMTPQAIIAGKILDADGDPFTRCMVSALQQRNFNGKKQWLPIGGGQVNDLGEYRLANLTPGRYYIQVSPQRFNMMAEKQEAPKDGVEEGYVPTYYPNAMDMEQAVAVDVTAGAEMQSMDIRMAKTRVVRVKGKAIDVSSNKGAIGTVLMLAKANSVGFSFFNNVASIQSADGSFEFTNVTPGSYTIRTAGVMPGQRGRSAFASIEVGNKNVENVAVTVSDAPDIKGTVRIEGQEKPQFGALQVMFQQSADMLSYVPPTGVKDDGSFTLTSVTPGKYRVFVYNLPDGTYLKAALNGTQDVLATGLDTTSSAPGSLDIVLGSNAPKVTGTVLDDKQQPVSGAAVVLVPEESKRDQSHLYQTSRTDQNGNFTIKAGIPGDYTAYAFEDMEDMSYQDPEFLKQYSGSGTTVKLKEGDSQSLQLKLASTKQ